jgi:hypothetical protein
LIVSIAFFPFFILFFAILTPFFFFKVFWHFSVLIWDSLLFMENILGSSR